MVETTAAFAQDISLSEKRAYLLSLVENHPCARHELFEFLSGSRLDKRQIACLLRNYDAHASVLRRLLLNAAAIMPEEAVTFVLENVRNEYGNGDYSRNHQGQLRDLAWSCGISPDEFFGAKIQAGVADFIKQATRFYLPKRALMQAVLSGIGAGDAGIQSALSGIRAGDAGIQSALSGIRAGDAGIQSALSGIGAGDAGMQSALSGIGAGDAGIQSALSDIRRPGDVCRQSALSGMKTAAISAGAITATELMAIKEFAVLQRAFAACGMQHHIWFHHVDIEVEHSDESLALALHFAEQPDGLRAVEYGLRGVLDATLRLYDGLLASAQTPISSAVS